MAQPSTTPGWPPVPGADDGFTGITGPLLIVSKGDSLEDHVNFADIVAVEVFRGTAEVPPELALGFEECGVIMIWTVWSERRSKKAGGGGGAASLSPEEC